MFRRCRLTGSEDIRWVVNHYFGRDRPKDGAILILRDPPEMALLWTGPSVTKILLPGIAMLRNSPGFLETWTVSHSFRMENFFPLILSTRSKIILRKN